MRKNILEILVIIATTYFSLPAVAADHAFGAGIIIGAPTGLSFQYKLSEKNSIDAALAWSGSVDLHMHADYLWHKPKLFYLDSYPVDWFFGGGLRLEEEDGDDTRNSRNDDHDDDTWFGLRAPVGLDFQFRDPRIEIFVELALIMNVTPETDADLDAGIGARYYF